MVYMNNKGVRDQLFTCEECSSVIPFKGYSSDHRFCDVRCAGAFRSRVHWVTQKKAFDNGTLKSRAAIYRFLVERDGDQCSVCSITEWNNKPIRLWVDHIDGNAANNMPLNFRLICPNCDSQSDTFGARNKGSGRKSRGLPQYG